MPGESDRQYWWGGNASTGYQYPAGSFRNVLFYPGFVAPNSPEALQAQQQAQQAYQTYEQYSSTRQRKLEPWIEKYGEKCQRKYEKRLERKQESEEGGEVINKFLLGCDPEFVAMDGTGKTITLNIAEDEIGTDHRGRVGEFRPKPCKGAFALVKRLQKLIASPAIERIRASKLRAGARANEESLGGHIHFGFKAPSQIIARDVHGNPRFTPGGLYMYEDVGDKDVIKSLDKITGLLEHLDILPQNESANRRRGQYGKFGDVRDSNGHMEYRSMCSWLYDPKVAYLCLTTAKIAAADPKGTLEALNRVTSFAGLQRWLENYRKDSNASRALEKIGDHKMVQVSPDVDFRERWRTLGI